MKITAKAIIEVAGFPKEHVEKSIQDIASQLVKNEEFKVISKEIEEVKCLVGIDHFILSLQTGNQHNKGKNKLL